MLNCQNCDNPCFDFEETGICPRESSLPQDVCPMFEKVLTKPEVCFFSVKIVD